MITAVKTAQSLDWKGWILGFVGAFVSGGAGAVGALIGVSYVDGQDPDHFIMQGHRMIELVGIVFLFSGIVSLAKFLQTHPVPEIGPNLLADNPPSKS